MPISSVKKEHYKSIFENQSYLDFKRQASKIGKCKSSLIWEKNIVEEEIIEEGRGKKERKFETEQRNTLEPVIDPNFFSSIKKKKNVIADKEESSKIAIIWARVLNSKIADEKIKVSASDLSSFFNPLKESFRCLSFKHKNKINKNYEKATALANSIIYNIENLQPNEQKRIRSSSLESMKNLRKKMEEPEALIDRDSFCDEVVKTRKKEEPEEELPSSSAISKSEPSSNKSSLLAKGICSVAVVAISMFLMMLYNNEQK